MNKKLFIFILLCLTLAGVSKAMSAVYNGNVANEACLTYDKTFDIDLNTAGPDTSDIDAISAQAVYSSPTVSAVDFTDGHVSTGSLTVVSTAALAAAAAHNTITVVSTAPLSASAAHNTITVVSTNGLTGATLTINGIVLTEGKDWSNVQTASGTAKSISRAILNNFSILTATFTSGGVVYTTATASGSRGNAYTIVSSTPAALAAGAAAFSGGQDNAYLTLNGQLLRNGVEWTATTTASGTAKSISAAIMARASLSNLIQTTWTAAGVVSATSTATGGSTNYSLASSTPAALSVFAARMYGGLSSAYVLSAANVHVSAHGLATGLGVWFSTSSSVGLSPLVCGTTYYAIRVDADNFELSDTSTGAIAGNYITFTSSSATPGNTFTVHPTAFAGTYAFKWQASNDGTNFFDLSVTSVTYSAPGTYGWDFSTTNYRYLRVNVDAGTGGGLTLKVIVNGKNTK